MMWHYCVATYFPIFFTFLSNISDARFFTFIVTDMSDNTEIFNVSF